MAEKEIRFTKMFNGIIKQGQDNAKPDHCFLCQRQMSSFCNSHTVPQFVIKNISDKGKVINGFYFAVPERYHGRNGTANALTFKVICKECDQCYFQIYENEDALLKEPTNQLLASIALKNDLFVLSKYLRDKEVNKVLDSKSIHLAPSFPRDIANRLSIRDAYWSMRRSLKIIQKQLKSGFRVIYRIVLDYKVPIALQTQIVLKEYFGGIINNTRDYSEKNYSRPVQLCVFPLSTQTVVLLFYHKDDRNIVPFERAFQKLSEKEKLQHINYMIFKYTENFVINPSVPNEVLENEDLQFLFAQDMSFPSLEDDYELLEKIPNFLELSF